MFFVVLGVDKPQSPLRQQLIDEHRTYLKKSPIPVISAGPLMDENRGDMIGSLIILESTSREDVEDLMADEPFNRAGLFQILHIHRWHQKVGAFQKEKELET
ncbi:MAG: YciI family protein [Pseudomonadota bacterium]